MPTFNKRVISTLIVALLLIASLQLFENLRLRRENQALQQDKARAANQLELLTQEQREIASLLSISQEEIERLQNGTGEIHKLRGEVARMRRSGQDGVVVNASMKAWNDRIILLADHLNQMPDKQIPELQFLTEKDWANAAWDADLSTEDGIREALSKVREEAQNSFKNRLRAAIEKYAAENNGTLPADITQLASYFDPPIKDAQVMLRRYELLQNGKLSSDRSKPLARSIATADQDYDSYHEISLNGAGGSRFNRVREAVEAAARRFASENGGRMPDDPSQLAAYLEKPVDSATAQKYLQQLAVEGGPWRGFPSELREAFIQLETVAKNFSSANNGRTPDNIADLRPYLTTPEQRAAFQKLLEHEKKTEH